MTKDELVKKLKEIKKEQGGDEEIAHGSADDALLAYIDDENVTKAYNAIEKWYA